MDLLDLLATVASQTLASDESLRALKPRRPARRPADGTAPDRPALRALRPSSLLRRFAQWCENGADSRYECAFDPAQCRFQSRGRAGPAQHRMEVHLEAHLGPAGLTPALKVESPWVAGPGGRLVPVAQPGWPPGQPAAVWDHDYALPAGSAGLKREPGPGDRDALPSAAEVDRAESDWSLASLPRDVSLAPEAPTPPQSLAGFLVPDVSWRVQNASLVLEGHVPLLGRCEEHPSSGTAAPSLRERPGPTSVSESEEKRLAALAIDHLQRVGSSQAEYWCTICAPHRRYTSYSTMLGHFRSHAGFRPFECPICHDFFTRQHSLNYHMLIHNNETRFTCEECGKKFRHPSHFKVHKRKHTGESPYQCAHCQSRFKTRNTYKRHLKMAHNMILNKDGVVSPAATVAPQTAAQPVDLRVLPSTLDFIHDADSIHGNDEEVATLSRELERQDEILNQKRIQVISVSSEGSYYPSTDSEFSSPDREIAGGGERSAGLLDTQEEFIGLPQFGSSPPVGLAALAARFVTTCDSLGNKITPSPPLQCEGKSPNLLGSDHQSAFNRFHDQTEDRGTSVTLPVPTPLKRKRIFGSSDHTVIKKPIMLAQPGAQGCPPQALLARINGQQVYLMPQKAQTSDPTPRVGPSKLEQCLRYGSAAIQNHANRDRRIALGTQHAEGARDPTSDPSGQLMSNPGRGQSGVAVFSATLANPTQVKG